MKLHRRTFLHLAAGAATLPVVSRTATAQAYPTRPITLIVPFAPGGSTDVGARIVADHMSRTLGQQIVVQNVAGAGGTTGSTRAMRADPDGYTILMGQMGTHAAAVALYPNLAYKPDVDFEPIGMVTAFPLIVAARKDFPAQDLKEFIAYVKANAAKLNLAHAGVGSIFFTTCLLLNSILGAKPTLVPFNGGAPAMNALVAGRSTTCAPISSPAVRSSSAGTIKVYAIASATRNPAMPNVPTTEEAGLPAFQASAWNGLFAPRQRRSRSSTSSPMRSTRHSTTTPRASASIDSRRRYSRQANRGPQAFLALVKSEIARWSPIIKAANDGRQPLRRGVFARAGDAGRLPRRFYEKGAVRIHFEEAGSGFPLLVIAGGGLNSTISGLTGDRAPFNAIEEFKGEYRCIASDLRNANGGQSSGPLEADRPWDAYTDDHLGVMDHLGIDKFMVLGFCIGGPFVWNLLKRAPDRIVAAVLAQPSGSRPEARDHFYDNNMKGWGPELVKRRPEITMATVDKFLTRMYRTDADFVFTVTREFVRTCQTPVPDPAGRCARRIRTRSPWRPRCWRQRPK